MAKLNSKTTRLDAVKKQQRIRVIGFGWDDLHHPLSKGGKDYSPEKLFDHLINKIIPEQWKRRIPQKPTMELPSRKETKQLGTHTINLDALESRYKSEKEVAIKGAEKMREGLEASGNIDLYKRCNQNSNLRSTNHLWEQKLNSFGSIKKRKKEKRKRCFNGVEERL